jgi:hypothetical protein
MTRSEELHAAIQQELSNELCNDCADELCRSLATVCAHAAIDIEHAEKAIDEFAERTRLYLRLSWDVVKAGMGESGAMRQ